MLLARTIRWLSAGLSGLLIGMVWLYRAVLSPYLGGHCKFVPTCSQYFIDAVRQRGPVVGTAMGLWRIARCNPLSKGGYDPVAKDRQ